MMVQQNPDSENDAKISMFEAVMEYAWVHSAPLEQVAAIETKDQLPSAEIRLMGYEVTMAEALDFLAGYQKSSERMSANLVTTKEDDETPGKPVSPPVGLPLSSTPAEPAVIPFEKDISSGSCPLAEPLPTFTPPTSPTEPPANGQSVTAVSEETADPTPEASLPS